MDISPQLVTALILLGLIVFAAMYLASRWGAKDAYYDIARETRKPKVKEKKLQMGVRKW